MAKKSTAAWILRGLPEAPPTDQHGYVSYGRVWHPAMPSGREPLRKAVRLAVWSWAHWGRKVRRDIEFVRAAGTQGGLRARALDLVAVALFGLADRVHRSMG